MWRLALVLVSAMFLSLAGCAGTNGEGDVCDQDADCDDGLVCASEVLSCHGDDCWGSCERSCDQASSCEGGEVCVWVGTARVCRSEDYQDPY